MFDVIDIFNLCAHDPKAGLKLIQSMQENDPEIASEPIAKFAKAMDYADKGLRFSQGGIEEGVPLSDEALNDLERALLQIRGIEETAPGFFSALAVPNAAVSRARVNAVVTALERHRPGRVQELLGTLKFKYEFLLADSPAEEKVAAILNLCESDPDAGLEILESVDMGENPLFTFAKALAYGSKGLFQMARSKPWIDITTTDADELREELGLSDEQLDYLELALQEVRGIEDAHPGFVKEMGTLYERKVDGMAIALERCRPGRVQAILGKTKLLYFGPERLVTTSLPGMIQLEDLAAEERKLFLNTFFSFRHIVRAAMPLQAGKDARGRKYIECMLFERTPDDPLPGDTLDETLQVKGAIYLFDDGTFSETLEEHKSERREKPKRRGFFKRFFG